MPNSQQEENAPGHADARTPDPGANSAPGDLGEPTLYEFLTRLATSPDARQAFDADPRASLDQAGLGEMTATDVLHATSLVLDYAPVEVVENYGRTLQDSADKFATSSQYAAINHLHPAHPHEQEVTELSMLNSPSAPSHNNEHDHTNMHYEEEHTDSHNGVSIHDVASGNNLNDVAGLGDASGNVTNTVNHTVDTAGDLTANVGNVTETAGDLTANVGNVTGVVGDVTGAVGGVAGVAGGVTGADASALPVEGLAGGVGSTLETATEPVGGLVDTATAPVEPVLDTATAPVEPVTSALPVGDVVSHLPAPSELPVVGGVAGGAVENVAGALPLDGLL